MSFQTPITIVDAVKNIEQKRYLLPAIQREVVWGTDRIEKLFDSLLRGYPISSFLFWFVDRKKSKSHQFYEFVREYHERNNKHNKKANVSGQDDITGVLDGQQRLTAIYLGLKGSYAYKEPRKRWDNPSAFPTRHLYLNLLKPASDETTELYYDFQFLTDSEAQSDEDSSEHWFKVGDILDIKEQYAVNDYLIEHQLNTRPPKEAKFANRTLFELWKTVHDSKVINFFLEMDESLDKVLQIFVRINSGGVTLNYSDLLLSMATASWTKHDAREEITSFVDELNSIGRGFSFNKDFILKSCLVLDDRQNIAFKVDNFKRDTMLQIEQRWEDITNALRSAVTLIASFAFDRETLTSNNAAIPIAYYLLKSGLPTNFDVAAKYAADRAKVKHFLLVSLLKRTFGGQADVVLRRMRDAMFNVKEGAGFPLDAIKDKLKGTDKTLTFTPDEIDALLDSHYGQSYTFATLALLYPNVDLRNKFHVDHIHPKSMFTHFRLNQRGIPVADADYYIEQAHLLPNLQLLEGVPNQEKSSVPFIEWLPKHFTTKSARVEYMVRNDVPDVDLALKNFREFVKERRRLLKIRVQNILKV